jgi:septal ring factor EnvC (AmiA/AmiB activator)
MDKASEAIFSLQPVTFRYKTAVDPKGIPQFGLVAEQVEKVNPDLVARDEQGKPYSVRYEAVNAMLLNEFLKEHRKVETQEATIAEVKSTAAKQATAIAQQQKEIQTLTAALKAQAVQIQNVSDQIRTQALAPRVVAND